MKCNARTHLPIAGTSVILVSFTAGWFAALVHLPKPRQQAAGVTALCAAIAIAVHVERALDRWVLMRQKGAAAAHATLVRVVAHPVNDTHTKLVQRQTNSSLSDPDDERDELPLLQHEEHR